MFENQQKKLAKWSIFGIFNELLYTQNVKVARFARNVVKWAFLINFQTLCLLCPTMYTYLWEAFTTLPRYLRAFCTFLPSWALSWFTSGPTSRFPSVFSYLSKSLRNRLKSRPSWEPERRKSSWCFRLLGSFPSSHEISVKLNWELNLSSWRAFRGLFWVKKKSYF